VGHHFDAVPWEGMNSTRLSSQSFKRRINSLTTMTDNDRCNINHYDSVHSRKAYVPQYIYSCHPSHQEPNKVVARHEVRSAFTASVKEGGPDSQHSPLSPPCFLLSQSCLKHGVLLGPCYHSRQPLPTLPCEQPCVCRPECGWVQLKRNLYKQQKALNANLEIHIQDGKRQTR